MTRHVRVSLQGSVSPRTVKDATSRAAVAVGEIDRLNGLSGAFVLVGTSGLTPDEAKRLCDHVYTWLQSEQLAP